MSEYNQEKVDKKTYYLEKARLLSEKASKIAEYDRECMTELVIQGHYNDKRYYRESAKSELRLKRYSTLIEKAKYYDHRAEIDPLAITSNDRYALIKLRGILTGLEEWREKINQWSAAYQSGGWEALSHLSRDILADMKRSQTSLNRKKSNTLFSAEVLTTLDNQICEVKQRIGILEQQEKLLPKTFQEKSVFIGEDNLANYVYLTFGKKPDEAIRLILKAQGFFSNHLGEIWKQTLSNEARYAARQVMYFLLASY